MAQPDFSDQPGLEGDTPAIRLFALLELIAGREEHLGLSELVEATGTPKPTLHRMLQQLEAAGLTVRQNDGRQYSLGERVRRFAEAALVNSTRESARHSVLQGLVDELGETCNLTALSGTAVIYLDRIDTPEPLRFHLQPGSRVPAHCSASGKAILAQFPRARRLKLLGQHPLRAYTDNTITEIDSLLADLDRTKERGYGIDAEEFLPGLTCAAVLVPTSRKYSNLCVASQAPVSRISQDSLADLVPALKAAAAKIAEIEDASD